MVRQFTEQQAFQEISGYVQDIIVHESLLELSDVATLSKCLRPYR